MLGILDESAIEELLHAQTIGRIGCHADGQTYVVPISYVYDGEAFYAHSLEGRKIQMMRANPAVCFQVERVKDMAHWESVIVDGRYEELRGIEAESGLRLLLTRFLPLMAAEKQRPHAEGLKRPERPVIFRIRVEHKSGRFEAR